MWNFVASKPPAGPAAGRPAAGSAGSAGGTRRALRAGGTRRYLARSEVQSRQGAVLDLRAQDCARLQLVGADGEVLQLEGADAVRRDRCCSREARAAEREQERERRVPRVLAHQP